MEESKKRKLLDIVKMTAFFLFLFCMFCVLYKSPFSYLNDNYGLFKGPKERIVVENIVGVLDFIYIRSINFLYLFLGEKPGVIIGYHIFIRMVCCVLLFFAIGKAKKRYPACMVTFIYGILPFVLYGIYNYDGILIGELFVAFFLFVIASIIKAVLSKGSRKKQQAAKENEIPVQPQGMDMAGEDIINTIKKKTDNDYGKKEEGNLAVPNFLEISDEEIRRNAMIAAGLLSEEEEKKEKEQTRGTAHTQFIENPLPVPKKHVKKEMDYEYQVPEEKMHFDIEEPDKNYFDIV